MNINTVTNYFSRSKFSMFLSYLNETILNNESVSFSK